METFEKGYIWRIGTGEHVNIWTDPWIPSSPDRMVISPRGQTVLTKVCELIDMANGTWDEAPITRLFDPVDAHRIIQIPLHLHGFDDFVA